MHDLPNAVYYMETFNSPHPDIQLDWKNSVLVYTHTKLSGQPSPVCGSLLVVADGHIKGKNFAYSLDSGATAGVFRSCALTYIHQSCESGVLQIKCICGNLNVTGSRSGQVVNDKARRSIIDWLPIVCKSCPLPVHNLLPMGRQRNILRKSDAQRRNKSTGNGRESALLLPCVLTKSISAVDKPDLPDANLLLAEFYHTVEAAVNHLVVSRDMHKLVRERRQLNNFGGGNFGQGGLGGLGGFGQQGGGGAANLFTQSGPTGDLLGGLSNVANLASLGSLTSDAASGIPPVL
ncbi:hypothetical protein DAPPUDRAFT_247233 [Daphnia pulex]|uniref:Uncharacterized protein n=1 Tax=Daphnia pulex TaxID=6669 RepID=E9GS12_DAPPU|nr:hypothetical protein DAPPUDRAFT_247233 [Daphnia pulex]|eukprot:EFX77619.1 hypothetical protein DAPPUDRAFT_247233 [Daphnia pulex]